MDLTFIVSHRFDEDIIEFLKRIFVNFKTRCTYINSRHYDNKKILLSKCRGVVLVIRHENMYNIHNMDIPVELANYTYCELGNIAQILISAGWSDFYTLIYRYPSESQITFLLKRITSYGQIREKHPKSLGLFLKCILNNNSGEHLFTKTNPNIKNGNLQRILINYTDSPIYYILESEPNNGYRQILSSGILYQLDAVRYGNSKNIILEKCENDSDNIYNICISDIKDTVFRFSDKL